MDGRGFLGFVSGDVGPWPRATHNGKGGTLGKVTASAGPVRKMAQAGFEFFFHKTLIPTTLLERPSLSSMAPAQSLPIGAWLADFVSRIGERDAHGIAGVPRVLGHARLLRGGLGGEGRKGRAAHGAIPGGMRVHILFMPDASFLEQRVALLGQCFELLGLLRDPVRVALLILGAGVSGGLLDQLPDVVAQDGDARIELGERRRTAVAHHVCPGSSSMAVRPS